MLPSPPTATTATWFQIVLHALRLSYVFSRPLQYRFGSNLDTFTMASNEVINKTSNKTSHSLDRMRLLLVSRAFLASSEWQLIADPFPLGDPPGGASVVGARPG